MNQRTGRDEYLVSAAALAAELARDPVPALLDVRWRLGGPPGIQSYREGHLPGAVFADLDRDLSGPPGAGGRHPLPDAAAFQAAMRAAGVSRDRPVVVYDDGDATVAARVDAALLRAPGRPPETPRTGGLPAPPVPPWGAYCGSGVTAAHEVLALTLAGLPAALYVGSWSEWVADPARPVATGG